MTQKKNDYKNIMDHVEIPDDVWNQTLIKMESAKSQRRRMLLWKKAAAVCVLVVVCVISVIAVQHVQADPGPVFLSAMQEDSEYAYVELEEGALTFDKTDELSDLQVQTGSLQGTKKEISWDRLEELLNTDVDVSPLPSGFTKTKQEALQIYNTDGKEELLGTLEYEHHEAYIHLQVEKGEQSDEAGRQNSQMNGIGLYMAMQKSGVTGKSREYLAQFTKHDSLYTLCSSGISQKEFIKLVYFLTK